MQESDREENNIREKSIKETNEINIGRYKNIKKEKNKLLISAKRLAEKSQ